MPVTIIPMLNLIFKKKQPLIELATLSKLGTFKPSNSANLAIEPANSNNANNYIFQTDL